MYTLAFHLSVALPSPLGGASLEPYVAELSPHRGDRRQMQSDSGVSLCLVAPAFSHDSVFFAGQNQILRQSFVKALHHLSELQSVD